MMLMNPNVYYNPFANALHMYYCAVNPLKMAQPNYWSHVQCFVTEINNVLYSPGHTHNLCHLGTESYYFLCKLCIDKSFSVSDLILLRNDRTEQLTKVLANEISHNLLPLHIIYLRGANPRPIKMDGAKQVIKCIKKVQPTKISLNEDTSIPLGFYSIMSGNTAMLPPMPHVIPNYPPPPVKL